MCHMQRREGRYEKKLFLPEIYRGPIEFISLYVEGGGEEGGRGG